MPTNIRLAAELDSLTLAGVKERARACGVEPARIEDLGEDENGMPEDDIVKAATSQDQIRCCLCGRARHRAMVVRLNESSTSSIGW